MKIGIIGGSGIYNMDAIRNPEWLTIDTPFGKPSDQYLRGQVGRHEVVFLPRHGRGHVLLPSEINHRANIYGFKKLGVERIIAVSAVGSLREGLHPRDIVLPSQFYDRTKSSLQHTFFGRGIVAHVQFAHPICPDLQKFIFQRLDALVRERKEFAGQRVHSGGTYVNMEGPAFSTRAESFDYRRCGFDIIGMTSLGEAKLSREAEICYVNISLVTDFDCWHEEHETVSLDMILENLSKNTAFAQAGLLTILETLGDERNCTCGSAISKAIVTAADRVPAAIKEELKPIIGKYIS